MLSNLPINRTLAKNAIPMDTKNKTVSRESMEEEWVQIQAAQQDPRQFRPLYNTYFDPIFRFVFRRTADENVTADVCSQVFLKAIQKIGSYKYKGVPFSAWLYRIASNEVAQFYCNTQKSRTISLEEHQVVDIIEEIEESDQETYRFALIESLHELKEADVQLIEMRFFEQRPFKEIAAILDITESNAKVKTYRILEKLKKHIQRIKKEGGRAPEL